MSTVERDTPERLEKSVEIGTLYAFYGGLLTQRQQEALRLHYEEDLSLGEIADQMEGSRQNVHELITRSAQKLRHYEEILGMAGRARRTAEALRRADELLENAAESPAVREARVIMRQIISSQEGEENEYGL